MADLLRKGLREEGYSVDIAANGTEALWLGREVDYDAIVLDVMLPGMDGFDVCRQLRRNDRWAPVIMVTARGDVADRVRDLDAGADDYLPKPFSLVELSARLRALVRRGRSSRPAVLQVGTLRMDTATRRVWRAGTAVDLSATEFALLELFLRHPGEVLTRSSIMSGISLTTLSPTLSTSMSATSGGRSTARSGVRTWRPYEVPGTGCARRR